MRRSSGLGISTLAESGRDAALAMDFEAGKSASGLANDADSAAGGFFGLGSNSGADEGSGGGRSASGLEKEAESGSSASGLENDSADGESARGLEINDPGSSACFELMLASANIFPGLFPKATDSLFKGFVFCTAAFSFCASVPLRKSAIKGSIPPWI